MAISDITIGVVDDIAPAPDLWRIAMLPVAGTATLTGYYVGASGEQLGASVTYSFTTAKTFIQLAASAAQGSTSSFPADAQGNPAVGFNGTLSGANIYVALAGKVDGTIANSQPDNKCPSWLTGPVAFGKVNAASTTGGPGSVGASVTVTNFPAVSTITPQTGTFTDKSGTITVGGTSQQLAASNSSRKYLLVQNLDAANNLYINFGVAAVQGQPSILIPPSGGSWESPPNFAPTSAVNVIGPSTSQAFAAKEA